MNENKIFCSADEYAWLEKSLRNAASLLDRVKNAAPGSVAHSKISAREQSVHLYEQALATFEVRADSMRSGDDDHYELSPEFQEAFGKIEGAKISVNVVVTD